MRQRPDGLWETSLDLHRSADGKRNRKTFTSKSAAEAIEKRERYKHEDQPGKGADMLFEHYADRWLEHQALYISGRTQVIYKSELTRQLYPELAQVKLRDIDVARVREVQLNIAQRISPRSARQARGRLLAVMQMAVDDGILPRNPVLAVKPIKVTTQRFDIWTAHEVQRFLKYLKVAEHRLHPLCYLALTTGMRPGELIALRWENVQSDRLYVCETVTVPAGGPTVGPPKTAAGRRWIDLPEDTQRVVYEHRLRSSGALVFPSEVGTRLNESNLLNRAKGQMGEADVKKIRLHDMRHTFASMAIADGIDVQELATILGHSDPSFTLRFYSHFFERRKKRTARTLEALLGAA